MWEGSLSEGWWSTHRQDRHPKRHKHNWKGEMKASNLEKIWTDQTHYLIVMNLHSQLMGTGNDIDLKYVDEMVLLCTRGCQPADVNTTRSRASDYRRDRHMPGEHFLKHGASLSSEVLGVFLWQCSWPRSPARPTLTWSHQSIPGVGFSEFLHMAQTGCPWARQDLLAFL